MKAFRGLLNPRQGWFAVSAIALSACAPKPPVLPSGPGTPFPGFASAWQQASGSCGNVHTLTASLSVSGHAGRTKLRGRIDAGFAEPAKLRLEGVAPFGKPAFVLTADDDKATLVLPRQDGVLQDASADAIIEALAGVPIDAAALRTVLAGCGFGAGQASAGERYSNGWLGGAVGAAHVFLRGTEGAWQIAGGSRGPLTVLYSDMANGRPATARLLVQSSAPSDLTVALSEEDVNTTLDPRTFVPVLPDHPVRVTLDDLRRAGPLGASR